MTTSTPQCPFHAGPGDRDADPAAAAATTSATAALSPAPSSRAAGAWPPGPAAGLTGWGLLRRMSQDMLGAIGDWRREFGDVVHLRMWPEHEIVVTDPERVRELLVTHHDALIRWERGIRVFSQLHGHSVLIAEASAWKHKRQALNPAFSPKAVQAFVPTIVQAAEQALARWTTDDTAPWPIESALTSLTMDVIVRMMFSDEIGADDARVAEAAVHTSVVTANEEFFWPASWPDWMPWKRRKREAIAALKGLIERHLSARLQRPRDAWPDDLLTRLLDLHRDDASAWPLQAVRDECMTTFLAGHETTAATLTWWAWCMAAHPQAQATARAEVRGVLGGSAPTPQTLPQLRYLAQTLQETLRLYPAAPLIFTRRTTRPTTLGPWQLPKGCLFMVPVLHMQHDARWFPEPERFLPERFAPDAPEIPRGAYMPFGTGPRVCLGQHLAMAEMTVMAAMLLQRFTLRVPEGLATPEPVLNISLRPKQALRLLLSAAEA